MVTTTLFKYIQSELIKQGVNEMVEPDESSFFEPKLDFLWYDKQKQYTYKIITFDEDVQNIVNDLFADLGLNKDEHDKHFKRAFINHFANRQINRQTIEAFQMQLVSVFMSYQEFLNRIYEDMEKLITQSSETDQTNKESDQGTTTTNNRSAFSDLPQDRANLDVDDTNMNYPTDNTISKNKEEQENKTDGQSTTQTKTYSLDELFKTNGLLIQVLNEFDKKCFLQVW